MRMWEIRENTGRYDHDDEERYGERYGERMGYRGKREKTVKEAYECGYEDGYKAAMEEIEEDKSYKMGERRGR